MKSIITPLAIQALTLGVATAAITYADPVDIVIPLTFGGVYLDLDTSSPGGLATGSAQAGSYTLSHSEPLSWDLNFFFGGAGIAYSDTLNPYILDSSYRLSAVQSLGAGQLIDGSTPIGGSLSLSTPGFGGSGAGLGGDSGIGALGGDHMGIGSGQFDGSTNDPGFIAFVLDPGTAAPQYGWMRVTLNEDGTTGLIHDWAYSDQPIAIGAVPEPQTALLTVLGALALWKRRR
ncbi:PEP-CTERM sorting domain-containing protein [Verrucomicrobiaceae bacterium 227]